MISKPMMIGVGVVIAAVAVGGTVVSRSIGKKIIENQTGAKVDINTNGNGGKMTIKTTDGEVQYAAGGNVKLPDGFPEELMVVNDAKLNTSVASDKGTSVTYSTNADSQVVFNDYVSKLATAGWKKEMEVNSEQGKMLTMTKDDQSAYIQVVDNSSSDNGGKTLVTIVWSKK